MKTCGYVKLAKKLASPKQHLFMMAGVSTIDLLSVNDEDGEDGVVTDAAKDLCPFLEIWYVFLAALPVLILSISRFESLTCLDLFKKTIFKIKY